MPRSPDRNGKHIFLKLPEELPAPERRVLEEIVGPEARIEVIVDSDLLLNGLYGHSRLVLCHDRLLVVQDGAAAASVPLAEIHSAYCKDYVGNGLLEVRTTDGRRMELIRYSKTKADAFQEIVDRVNRRLQLSEDELAAQEEEVAKLTGPKEERITYRCPNCGYPLRHSSDVCPRCTNKREVMLRLLRLVLRGHLGLMILGLVLSIVFAGLELAPSYLVKQLVDKSLNPVDKVAAPQERFLWLGVIVIVFLGVIVVRFFVSHFRIRVMGTLGERVVTWLRMRLYRALQRLSLSYYDQEHTGRIMARVLSDTRIVQRFIVQAVQQILLDALLVVGIGVLLFTNNWKLAILALFPIPVVVISARYFSRRFRRIFRAVRRKYATLSAAVSESISGMRVVKSFAQEDREIDQFDGKVGEVYDARIAAVQTRARFNPLVGMLISVGVLAVWYVGGRKHIADDVAGVIGAGGLSLGDLLLFITLMQRFYNPVRQLINMTEVLQESATAAERVFNIMDMPSEVADHEAAIELGEIRGRIEIQDVSFAYNEGERVLKNINLTIEPGEMIGLVGQTGSGKSTLVALICRFYDPSRGQILLDGVNLKDIQVKSLRSKIGMVLQDPFLFAGTIRENIAYGKPEASELEIIRAAKAANAHDFIMNLPDGYDSQVGERGVMLSGGEKQRISIARAVLNDPVVLILDEATSAVDTATEAVIQQAMDRLVHGRTTIAIAHRLSTLRNADRLVVLEAGEIVEEGTHEELIARDGIYANLCKIQARFARAVPMEEGR